VPEIIPLTVANHEDHWKILTGAALLTLEGQHWQKSAAHLLVDDHADFTSAIVRAGATVGAVTKYGSGDKTYNYTFCAGQHSLPVQLPYRR